MRMLDVDLLLPEVMPHVRACPEPTAIRNLIEAARLFCERTRIWRDTDSTTIAAPDYEGICTVPDARIVAIEAAALNGVTLEPVALGWLDEERPGWQTETETGQARYLTQFQPNTVTLYPRQAGTLTMRLVLKPSRQAMQLPAFLVEDYGPQIAAGAVGEIMLLPDTEYTNPQLGAAHLNRFGTFLTTETHKANKGQQGARTRTKSRFF